MPQFDPPAGENRNGFLALAQHDENNDHVIDNRDMTYEEIRLWQDRDHDGVSQPDELLTLSEAGVAGISVDYKHRRIPDGQGNVVRYSAEVYPLPGATVGMTAWDVMLASPTKWEQNQHGIVPIPVPKRLPDEDDPFINPRPGSVLTDETGVQYMEFVPGGGEGDVASASAIAGSPICLYNRHITNPYGIHPKMYADGYWDLNGLGASACDAGQCKILVRLRNQHPELGSWHYVGLKEKTVYEHNLVSAEAHCDIASDSSYWQATIRTQLVSCPSCSPIDLGIFDKFTMAQWKGCNSFNYIDDPDTCE